MTSNIGARLISEPKRLGFSTGSQSAESTYNEMKNNVMGELKKALGRIFNRIDETIVFHSLEEEHLKDIVRLMLNNLSERLEQNAIKMQVSDDAVAILVKEVLIRLMVQDL